MILRVLSETCLPTRALCYQSVAWFPSHVILATCVFLVGLLAECRWPALARNI